MRLGIFILGLVLALQGPAYAKDTSPSPRLADYVLDSEQFFELTLEEKVVYMKFFMNMMATIEDMQDLPAEEQAALRGPVQQMMEMFISTADAASWRSALAGQPCLNSLNASTWVVNQDTGRIHCAAVKTEDCGGGLVSCGDSFTSLVPTLGRVCIPRSESAHRTARCIDKIADLAGPNLNNHMQATALSMRDPAEQQKYADRAIQMKAALETFQNQVIGKSSLRDYCRSSTGRALQAEECGKLKALDDQFKIATVIKADPYDKGIKYQEKPAIRAALDNSAQAKTAPATTAPAAGAHPAPPPQEPIIASQDQVAPAAAPTDEAAPPAKPEKTPAPAANPEPQAKPAKKHKKNSPAPASEKANSGDCESRHHKQLGALSCVACGLEKVAGAEVSRKGVENWLSLLGVSAQSFYGPYNASDASSKRALQQRVIEMVSSYGYCTDDQYNIDPGASESRDWIDGTRPAPHQKGGFLKALFPAQPDEVRFASTYQIASPRSQRMSFAAELFNDSDSSSGWDQGNVQQRQWRFRSKLAAHAKTYKGSAFGRCAAQIEDKLAHSTNFKMCQITKSRSAAGGIVYPDLISSSELAANNRVYEAMANACHLPAKRRQASRQCDNTCWGSRLYPSSAANLRNCDHDHGDGGHQHTQPPSRGEPEHHRDPPSKAEEPSTPRSGTYGGTHDRSNDHHAGSNNAGHNNGGNSGGSGAGGEHSSTR